MTYKVCPQCDRNIRPRGTSKQDHPGTIIDGSRGVCGSCYQRQYRQGEVAPRKSYAAPASDPIMPMVARDVLVRVDLTSDAYRTLNDAKLNIGLELSKYADRLAKAVKRRAA